MSIDSQFRVQEAVYNLLSSDPGLFNDQNPDSLGVFDHVPRTMRLPYIVIDRMECRADGTQDAGLYDVTVTLHFYTRQSQGLYGLRQLMAAAAGLIQGADALSITDHRHISTRLIDTASYLEEDGETRHGIMRFSILTEPIGD